MRAWCPHCGALNEFKEPPAQAVVYCQECAKPFSAAALMNRKGSEPKRTGPRAPTLDQTRKPSESRGPTTGTPAERLTSGTGEPKVIVPGNAPSRRSSPGAAKLVYRSPDGLVTDFVLENPTSLGRHPKNLIRLNDREISKEHAILERRVDDWWIRDLGSSNGTYLNSRRIQEAKLQPGDELVLGSMRLSFELEGNKSDSARDLVTILPQDPAGSTHIHAKLVETQQDFQPVDLVSDVEVLKRDYEKLRLTHELSRIGLTTDLAKLLSKTLDVVFSMLPADNGVIMLVDEDTNTLVPHTVRRKKAGGKDDEIILSSTILNGALQERASVLLSDAFIDPRFSGSQSIIAQGIRAAMCVPMVAHDKVLGVMHLDTRERVGAFTEKDLQLLKAIATQTAIAIQNARLVRQIEEEAKARGQLSRFLPPHVVEEMVQGKGRPIQKGGREVEASVVFCDIRGFTSMSESKEPQDVVDLLNEYFERLVEVVFKRNGVLDKFIGDALMASWGAIENGSNGEPVIDGVAAALDFRDTIAAFNAEREGQGLAPVEMGVGVNTGSLVAGYMGSKRRLEFTVIGDTVNTASRLCGIASGGQVLISEATHRLVADRIEARYLGTRQVKGKSEEIGVYEALRLKGG